MSGAGPGALSGIRVLELADESGAYCGKLLADLGAEVIKIERPGGDASRRFAPRRKGAEAESLFFFYMNTGKRGVTLDLERSSHRDRLLALAKGADIVVETLEPGALDALDLGYDALRELNPGLVLTSITGFGQTGPRRGFRSSDLVASALGGALYVTGEPEDPPVTLAGSQAHIAASTCAAASSLIALHHRRRTGAGQHVDVSAEEVMIAVSHVCGVGKWLDDGHVPRRHGTALVASVPSGAYRCRDGLVYLMVNRPLHWKALARWIHEETGIEEVLDVRFEGPSSRRIAERALLDRFIVRLTEAHSVEEIYHEGQRRHIAFTPVQGVADVVGDPHLAARDFFVEVADPDGTKVRLPGAPYRLSRTPWRIAGPSPGIGEHDAEIFGTGEELLGSSAPRLETPPPSASTRADARASDDRRALAGLRVVEFTMGMAGPWIGRFMAWCGAEVVKVESRQHPTVVRLYISPDAPELGIQSQLSPWFTDWDAGKRFVALDLQRPEAVELAKRLVARADVVVENYRSGVMEKLGLGYEALRRVNPDIIYFGSSGYGDTGPTHDYVTWGPNIEALSGMSTLSGFPERPCTVTQYAYPDGLSALHGLTVIMAALDHRKRSGEGQQLSLSQLETCICAVGDVMLERLVNGRDPERLGNASRNAAPHGCYRCTGEDRWCAIAVRSEAEWQRFCALLGEPDRARDARFDSLPARVAHAAELDAWVGSWTAERSAEEVMARLQEAGIAAGVVQTVEDQIQADPQLAERHFFESIDHLAKGSVLATGIPLGLTGTPGRSERAGGAIGEDNDHVFGKLLGMSEAEIEGHIEAGAIERRED
ncbi:MAG: CoA transferase [Deltaproteobacteria bacterium]|nr:CoA transferase [Deltaproteobacteria bacterium]